MARPRHSERPGDGAPLDSARARGAATIQAPGSAPLSAAPSTATPAPVLPGPVPVTGLSRLLRARSFTAAGLGDAVLGRLTANLRLCGGELLPEGALADAWIGAGAPPSDRPAIAVGDEVAALGPRSFGFLNNLDGVGAYLAPLPERPRQGGVAVVVPRRDALPELGPLFLARRLGLAWLVSVGDGDPADAVQLLTRDPRVSGVLLCLGRGARAATLQRALQDAERPVVLLEQGAGSKDAALCRAVVRRAGGVAAAGLEDWLAHAALLSSCAHAEAGPAPRPRVSLFVLGGGLDSVSRAAAEARLPAPAALDVDEPEDVPRALAAAGGEQGAQALTVVCGPDFLVAGLPESPSLLTVDPAQPERLRALLFALGGLLQGAGAEPRPVTVKVDREKVASILADLPPPLYVGGAMVSEETLSDHDSKRLLHAYGARVTRQAPAGNITAALRVAGKLGLPVVLVPPTSAGDDPTDAEAREVTCQTQAELKRQATVLLGRYPHLLLREHLPDGPRLRLSAAPERGLGTVLRVGTETAVLPLVRGEARDLAEALCAGTPGPTIDPRGLVELLTQVAQCIGDQLLRADLTVYLAAEPVITHASLVLRRG